MHGIEAPAAGPVVPSQTLHGCRSVPNKKKITLLQIQAKIHIHSKSDPCLLFFQTQACASAANIRPPLQRAARQVRVNAVKAAQPRVFPAHIKKKPLGPTNRPVFTRIKGNIKACASV